MGRGFVGVTLLPRAPNVCHPGSVFCSRAQISLWIARAVMRMKSDFRQLKEASLPAISMKELLEAGVHFGHQTKRWNPKMKEYIFGERNGIYIIDLQKTLKLFKDAARYVVEMAAQGKTVLFVGTKRQAQEAIAEEANRCQMFYVNQRWLGGLLTNMTTVQKSIKRLKELEQMAAEGPTAAVRRRKSSGWNATASISIRIWPVSKTCRACRM